MVSAVYVSGFITVLGKALHCAKLAAAGVCVVPLRLRYLRQCTTAVGADKGVNGILCVCLANNKTGAESLLYHYSRISNLEHQPPY